MLLRFNSFMCQPSFSSPFHWDEGWEGWGGVGPHFPANIRQAARESFIDISPMNQMIQPGSFHYEMIAEIKPNYFQQIPSIAKEIIGRIIQFALFF